MPEVLAMIDHSDQVEFLISVRKWILNENPPNSVALLAAIAWRQREIVSRN